MKIILVLIIIFIILYFIFSNKTENMTNIVSNSNEIEQASKCCLVEKKYLPDNTSIYGGNFKYQYTNKVNNECDPSLYESNNNQQLLLDGVNNWSNENCNDQDTTLGSCRLIDNECIEFVDKKFCDKIPEMVWSSRTCHNPLDYVWEDTIVRNVPKKDKNDGSYTMFPEKNN